MEDVNMSQSAEQTATGNVPPGGQANLKRQVSADAFRALTLRLNGKAGSTPVLPPVPQENPEPTAENVVETAPLPMVEPTADVAVAEKPQQDILPEQVAEPQPQHQSEMVEPEAPVSGDVTEEVVEQPQEPQPVEAIAVEEAPQDAPAKMPPAFAMPASGTKIILNPTSAPKPRRTEQPNLAAETPVAVREAIHPGKVLDEQVDVVTVQPVPEPVAVAIDPLQAAMNLMNATALSDSASEPEPQEKPAALPEVAPVAPEIALSETATEALSQEVEIPVIDEPVSQPAEKSPISDTPVVEPVVEKAIEKPKQVTSRRPAQSPPVVGDAKETPLELEPDAASGETARALLDIMSSGSQPQERALAADTLLQLVPRMMVKDLVALSERVCMMEDAPPLLVKSLINHREARVAGPLLEDAKVINEQDLLRLIATTDVDRLIMMAKHRKVNQTVCDALIARGEPSVYLTLVRNPGAALSHDAFVAFNEIAKSQSSLQAPLATRGDTPPPIAFELFWSLPVELRRYVLSRFLTDSATLDKILKITQSVEGGQVGEQKFPPSRKVEELVDLIADGITDQAALVMAKLAGTNQENARRIIADPDGEPLTVVLKTMGLTRAQFSRAIKKCANSSKAMLRSDRDLAELQIMFDSLSFNKARTLLTYWDWAIEKTGPYTRRVM